MLICISSSPSKEIKRS